MDLRIRGWVGPFSHINGHFTGTFSVEYVLSTEPKLINSAERAQRRLTPVCRWLPIATCALIPPEQFPAMDLTMFARRCNGQNNPTVEIPSGSPAAMSTARAFAICRMCEAVSEMKPASQVFVQIVALLAHKLTLTGCFADCSQCPGYPMCQCNCQNPPLQSFHSNCVKASIPCNDGGYALRFGVRNCLNFQNNLYRFTAQGEFRKRK